MKNFATNSPMSKSILILGAGQLAQMLAEAALHLGHKVTVTSEAPGEPATSLPAVRSISLKDLHQVSHDFDLVIVESEFVDFEQSVSFDEALIQKIFPSVDCLQKLRSKVFQKQMADRLGVAQASWTLCDFKEDDSDFHSALLKKWREKSPKILKWDCFGYDGYGNFQWKPEKSNEELNVFVQQAQDRNVRIFAEEVIEFEIELALVACRALDNEFIFYPLVQTIQKDHRCYKVFGPASERGLPGEIEVQARNIAKAIAKDVDLFGVFALEFFYHSKRGLLFNELAPRVHNSGHFSLVQADRSQFSNHIRAATRAPLKSFEVTAHYGMLNLLGPCDGNQNVKRVEAIPTPKGVEFKWYQKKNLRLGRKMGHLHFERKSVAEVEQCFADLDRWEKAFWQSITEKEDGRDV